MNKHFAIFDMDGTLIDSMPAWRGLGKNFLLSRGITPPDDLRKIIAPMTLQQSAEYFKTLGVKGKTDAIVKALNSYMRTQYETAIEPRENVAQYLEAIKAAGVRCCVATATDEALARTCLGRLDLLKYFEFIVSCEDIGVGKTSPAVYHAAAERLGAAPADIAVYEDVPYAAETAKQAGYYVVGVYDPSAERHQERLKLTIDEYIADYAAAAVALTGEVSV
ncbi:HAD family hydrolase [Oscillospiraceae bacterium LTW-04]|nr:HAD family phosphatase [Oscillospiraceae bacterium MB24-C1]